MKIRNTFGGITLKLVLADDSKPLALKQRWEGVIEENKVLVLKEEVNIKEIIVIVGEISTDLEISMEEGIQNIKNIPDICNILREETAKFLTFFGELGLLDSLKTCSTESANSETASAE